MSRRNKSNPETDIKRPVSYVKKDMRLSGFTMSTPDKTPSISKERYKLIIPITLYNIILFLRQEVHPNEFAFEGVIEIDKREKRAFRLRKLYVPEQFASRAEVWYKNPTCTIATEEEFEFLTLHGHSHANMDAFWSKTDEEDIDDWMGDYRINLVINDYGKMLARVDFFSDIFGDNDRIGHENLLVKLEFPEEFRASCKEMLDSIHIVTTPATSYGPKPPYEQTKPVATQVQATAGESSPLQVDDECDYCDYYTSYYGGEYDS